MIYIWNLGGRYKMEYVFKDFNYGVFNYKEAEKLLNQMAAKGYEFKATGKGLIKGVAMFKKNEKAKGFKYAVDVRCNLSVRENEKQKYYSFFKDLGWKNLDSINNKLHVFVSEQNKAFPLYTDELSELENVKESVRPDGQIIESGVYVALMSLLIGGMIYVGFNRIVNDWIMIYISLFVVYGVSEITSNLVYMIRFKKYMKTGRVISENKFIKKLRSWNIIFSITSLILLQVVTIVGLSYEIWGAGLNPSDAFGTNWEISLLSMCAISIPILLVSTYMLFLYPKQEKFKVLSYIASFMYLFSSMEYITTYLIR